MQTPVRDRQPGAPAADGTDALLFAPEDDAPPPVADEPAPWTILVVDDEPEVHAITRLALQGLTLDGRGVALLDAHDAEEARRLLLARPDVALVLLDVVMEREHAGLDLARWIRGELGNRAIRIVLRTGQPGLAPEQRVMLDYDINDYRAKTELTAQRLVTTILGAVRSYRDISIIEEQKRGLTQVIDATATLFERRSMQELLGGVLTQLVGLFGPQKSALFVQARGPLFGLADARPVIVAGAGRFADAVGQPIDARLDDARLADLALAVRATDAIHRPSYSVYGLCHDGRSCAAVYVETGGRASAWEVSLAELFCRNATVALDNLRLHDRQLALLRAVERFVPGRVLDLLGRGDVTHVAVGDHLQREMTVLFADLRGFTALAERLSPEATFAFLNDFFAAVVPAIHDHGGVVDKYLGDGVMALFPGAPQDAVRAGLAMIARAREFAASRPELPAPPRLGVGVHVGPMILGLVGAADRLDFTAVADSVNITARIERLTRTFGADLLVSRDVHDRLGPELHAQSRLLGQVELRGRGRAVELFEVYAADPPARRNAKAASRAPLADAIAAMQAGRWADARAALAALAATCPEDPAIDALDRHCWRRLRLCADDPA